MNIMVRIYTFKELMHRLTSPTWEVTEFGGTLIFVPSIYKNNR